MSTTDYNANDDQRITCERQYGPARINIIRQDDIVIGVAIRVQGEWTPVVCYADGSTFPLIPTKYEGDAADKIVIARRESDAYLAELAAM